MSNFSSAVIHDNRQHESPHLFAHGQVRGGLRKKQPQQNVAEVCRASMHRRLLSALE